MLIQKDIISDRAWKFEEEVVSSIQKAVNNNDVNTISKMLIGKDLIITAFEEACGNGEIETVKVLIEAGISVMNEDAILKATYNERIEIVELLINQGLDKQFIQRYFGNVLSYGKAKIVELLLKIGVDPERQMYKNSREVGERYIIFATKNGYDEIVDLLIKYGANIYNRYFDSEHPLIIAAEKGYTKVVKVLLENGLSVKGDDEEFAEKAMRIAKREGFTEIVELLEKAGVIA